MELSDSKIFTPKRVLECFIILFIFGGLIRLTVGVGYYNPFDTTWYQRWAEDLPNGFFSVYERAREIDLDYPPIYLYFLYVTGWLFRLIGPDYHQYTQMLLMKMWPILGDLLCGVLLYKLFGRKNRLTGLIAGALWLFNPATIFNSGMWGQTDGIMCGLLLISFMALTNKRPVLASVLLAIAGLTKFQCLFFVPIFLLELYKSYGLKSLFKGILAAAGTVAIVFLPFMIGAKNPMLFFDVYLFGQGRYPYCTLNAYNFYGIFGLNWVEDAGSLIGPLSIGLLSNIILVLLVVAVILIYIFVKKPDPFLLSFWFMNSVFMFTTRMHERYQFVVLIFLLAALIIHRSKELFYLYLAFSVVILINHLVPMFSWNNGGSFINLYYGQIMTVFSVINLLLYIVSSYITFKFLFTDKPKKEAIKCDTQP